MGKCILVMDMPKCCAVCKMCLLPNTRELMCGASGFVIRDMHKIDEFCPLKEVPPYKEFTDYDEYFDEGFKSGYNTCIDEILGGGE